MVRTRSIVLAVAVLCPATALSLATPAPPAPAVPAVPVVVPGPPAPAAQQADPADVATPDAIVAALYDVISGPPGPRDWDRFHSLFHPQARLVPTGPDPRAPGARRTEVWTADEYIEQVTPFFDERGFYEREIGRVTESFGGVVHVFSAYESRVDLESEVPFQRGINSIQLVRQDDRWWILTVLWEGESDDNPIPDRYLRSE